VAEVLRRGWRTLWPACRGRSARGVADVVTASYGRRLAMAMATTQPGPNEGVNEIQEMNTNFAE
jgi:hypothetical protein